MTGKEGLGVKGGGPVVEPPLRTSFLLPSCPRSAGGAKARKCRKNTLVGPK